MISAFSELVDRVLRKTVVGRIIFGVRRINPKLYAACRRYYSAVFKFESQYGLERYQARAVYRFLRSVPTDVRTRFPVLEIGSDLDARVLRELRARGCTELVGINPGFTADALAAIEPELPDGCQLKVGDIRCSGMASESFGAVFSVSVFEHLLDFSSCLSEIHRILVPGGYVYAEYGPIWSSSLGHHVWADVGEEQARHWDPTKNPVDNFAHLLMGRDEFARSLKGKVSDELGAAIVIWVFDKPSLNRLHFEDYLEEIHDSEMDLVHLGFDREPVSAKLLKELRRRHEGYRVFDVRNIEVVLRKRSA